MKCPKCGKEIPDKSKFCTWCAYKLEESRCPKCGRQVTPGSRFCEGCGAVLQQPNVNIGGQNGARKNPKKKTARIIVIVIIVCAAIASAVGFSLIQEGVIDLKKTDATVPEEKEINEEPLSALSEDEAESELSEEDSMVQSAVSVQWTEETEYREVTGSEWGCAVINGLDVSGSVCWTVNTDTYELVGDFWPYVNIGENGDLYYYFENGELIALTVADGTERWRIDAGLTDLEAWVFDDEGTIYAGGYCKPNFIAVDQEGNLLTEITYFEDVTYRPTDMVYQEGSVMVTLYPLNSTEDDEMIQVTVNLENYTCEIIGTADETATAESVQQPFYGVWCSASKDESAAQSTAAELRSRGFDAQVFLTTDWKGLNSEAYYVVTAGVYDTKSEAETALSKVKAAGYSSAYVKYSGEWQG